MRLSTILFSALVLLVIPLDSFAAEVIVTIPANANLFTPRSIIINLGDTVTWQYPQGAMLHNVRSDTGIFTSGPPAAAPWTFSHTFFTAGTYPYYCETHGGVGGVGMSGIVFAGNRIARPANERVLQLSTYNFEPEFAPDYYSNFGDLTRYRSNYIYFVNKLIAGVQLPTGAEITGLELAGCGSNVSATLLRCIDPAGACATVALVSSGTPGCGFFGTGISGQHVDNLGTTYFVRVDLLNGASPVQRLRSVRIFYKLAVSYPPATARFEDVPASHPFFAFIEALAASGITTGCSVSPPQYCPDAPLTRGQMAVFLARALGLHWPN